MKSLLVAAASMMLLGCGPSPAMQPSHVRAVRVPPERVVPACPSTDDAEEQEEQQEDEALGGARPLEYVRMDEWEPPPSVKRIEARVEPRGDKPPDYVRLPHLTMHREIAPITTYRRGSYWR